MCYCRKLSQPQTPSSQPFGQIPSKYYQPAASQQNYQQPGQYSQPSGQTYPAPQYTDGPTQPVSGQYYQPAQYQPQQPTQPQQPQAFIQVQGPDGKPQYVPASSMPYYQRN